MIRRWAHGVAAPAIRALRFADTALGRRSGQRSILIEARTPLNLAVLRPVFRRLLTDPRLCVWFTGVERDDLRRAFQEFDVGHHTLARHKAAWTRFDLYINADPWDAVTLHRVRRQLNFFHGVAGKYDLDCPVHLPIGFDRYDRVAFPNADRLTRYVEAGIVSAERAALVGFPKVDALVNATDRTRAVQSLGLDRTRPTILYAPTFSPAASLHSHGEAIISTLLGRGWNLIAKLHDRSFDPDPKYNAGVNWRERLQRFTRESRFVLAETGDSTNSALASDLLVTDHSSIGFEFCVLDRPVVVVDTPPLLQAARINPEKVALLRSAATVVTNVEDLPAAVSSALRLPSRLASERARVARTAFYEPGSATDRALTLVYSMLELSPHATPSAVETSTSRSALRSPSSYGEPDRWSEAR